MLTQALRREALAGTELARAQVGTIRLKLLKVAARVVVFHLTSGYPYRAASCEAFGRLMARPRPVAGTG